MLCDDSEQSLWCPCHVSNIIHLFAVDETLGSLPIHWLMKHSDWSVVLNHALIILRVCQNCADRYIQRPSRWFLIHPCTTETYRTHCFSSNATKTNCSDISNWGHCEDKRIGSGRLVWAMPSLSVSYCSCFVLIFATNVRDLICIIRGCCSDSLLTQPDCLVGQDMNGSLCSKLWPWCLKRRFSILLYLQEVA